MSNNYKKLYSLEAEQGIIGALLRDNDSIDRIGNLLVEHFYSEDHAEIYREIAHQIRESHRADVISVMTALNGKVVDIGQYLNHIVGSTPSSAHIERHISIVLDKAVKRGLFRVAGELSEKATSHEQASDIADWVGRNIESLCQFQTVTEPMLIGDILIEHADLMEMRSDGTIKPVSTGFVDLDKKLGGGLERGTLTVAAGRPAMGKTAFGLTMCRNVAENGVSAFWSMEMSRKQVMDRNISAMASIPLSWIKFPDSTDEHWRSMTHAWKKAKEMSMYIDDQPGMNMLQLRSKARQVKRKAGRLDLLVIDQLSFITGSESDNPAYAVGEYTRGLVALAKELDCAVLLLAQLNRQCESRNNKRPMNSDLALSGSIEQDAATIMFLYRDEVYVPDSPDKGICEVIIGKARQGETGMVGLKYIGEQTKFADLARGTVIRSEARKEEGRSLAHSL
jgi:replicative DNA helicase